MSFTDPLSITVSAVTSSLPRVSVSEDGSHYQSGDGLVKLLASHDYGKRTRRVLEINTSKLTADPFQPAENVRVAMRNYIVFDVPPAGYTAAEQLAVFVGFNSLITASSNAMIVKLLGGES